MKKIKDNSRELYSQFSDLYSKMKENLVSVLKQVPERKLYFIDNMNKCFAYFITGDGEIEERVVDYVCLDSEDRIYVYVQWRGELLEGGHLLSAFTLMNINESLHECFITI